MFERRLYYHIDWALLIAVLTLCSLGVVMIYSTTSDPTHPGPSRLFITQLYAIVIGLVAMVVMMTIDYRAFTDKSHLIYAALLGLLIYVMLFGMVQMGARRWIPLRVFNLQPSEFAKIGVALVLAKFFGENRGTPVWTDLAIGGVLTLIPLVLIVREPDLGTAVTLLPVFAAIAFVAGMRMRVLGVLVLCVLASFTFQVVYNLTMSAGLAPVKWLTLPLMSYGGSSMIATLAGFGLILNVRMRRFTN